MEGGASCHSDVPMGTFAAELICHSTAVTFMSHVLSFGLKQAFQQPWEADAALPTLQISKWSLREVMSVAPCLQLTRSRARIPTWVSLTPKSEFFLLLRTEGLGWPSGTECGGGKGMVLLSPHREWAQLICFVLTSSEFFCISVKSWEETAGQKQ